MQTKEKEKLESLYTFFDETISPEQFAKLLDELLYHYTRLLIQAAKEDRTVIPENADDFLHYVKLFRDICISGDDL